MKTLVNKARTRKEEREVMMKRKAGIVRMQIRKHRHWKNKIIRRTKEKETQVVRKMRTGNQSNQGRMQMKKRGQKKEIKKRQRKRVKATMNRLK